MKKNVYIVKLCNWFIWVNFIKQTIETDVAVAATTFSIGVSTYLVICNYGNVRRYETKSRLYRVNLDSSLLVVNWRITNLLQKHYLGIIKNISNEYFIIKETISVIFIPMTGVLLFCSANWYHQLLFLQSLSW